MLKCIAFLLLIFSSLFALAQKNYNTHQGKAHYNFGFRNGILDSVALNPSPNKINSSTYCIKYRRNKDEIYDNLKLQLHSKLDKVSSYASYEENAPAIKLKIFSTAPIGTQVELQLGKKDEVPYPDGVHSQYQAFTNKQNEWEEIVFLFAQIPSGSRVNDKQVDQITILFAPNTHINNVFYFDDLTGPEFASPGIVVALE